MRYESTYPEFREGKRLMYITHPSPDHDFEEQTRLVIQGGGGWIQLRDKNGVDPALARRLVRICAEAPVPADLCVDDDVACALSQGAAAVHLGKKDLPPLWAKLAAGPRRLLVGATANTFQDIRWAVAQGADYIGLGPFRFTETKRGLSPTLGLEGYRHILDACRRAGIRIPVFAIGGITLEDVPALMRTGVTGIAVSGAILRAKNPARATRQFIETIHNSL